MKNLEKMEKPLGGVLLFLLMLSIGFSESSDQRKFIIFCFVLQNVFDFFFNFSIEL